MARKSLAEFLTLQIFLVFLDYKANAKQCNRTTSVYKTKTQNAEENKYVAVDCACVRQRLGIHFLSKVWLRTYSLSSFLFSAQVAPSQHGNTQNKSCIISPTLFYLYPSLYLSSVDMLCSTWLYVKKPFTHYSNLTAILRQVSTNLVITNRN